MYFSEREHKILWKLLLSRKTESPLYFINTLYNGISERCTITFMSDNHIMHKWEGHISEDGQVAHECVGDFMRLHPSFIELLIDECLLVQ